MLKLEERGNEAKRVETGLTEPGIDRSLGSVPQKYGTELIIQFEIGLE